MSFLPGRAIPSAGVGAYNINNSLRFRSSAGANLNRTFSSSPTVRTKQTFSLWIKRGLLSSQQRLIDCYDGSSTFSSVLYFLSNDTLQFDFGGSAQNVLNTTQVFRDPSAWYHLVLEIDTTQAAAGNRVKIYVNGLQVTSFVTANYPAQNSLSQLTFGNANNRIAANFNGTSDRFDGYLTEVNFIDGQALTPTSFGETNATTGVWQPKAYTGTYGNNGFELPFSNINQTPTLVNTTSASQTNAAQATITVNVPSGVANGNLLILVLNGGNNTVYTTPAGWTLWFATTNVTAVFYKTASSEPASYTVTGSTATTAIGFMLAYRNAAIDVIGALSATTANPIVAPAITTTATNTVVIAFIRNGGVSETFTTPSGFTNLVSESDASDPSGAIFTKTQAAAGSTGTASSTPTSTGGRGIQFSIKPSGLGTDFSGNNNNWNTNNISLTAGTTYDAMTDSPTNTSETVGNYCVLNPLSNIAATPYTLSNANLNWTITTSATATTYLRSTMAVSSGKWYWEVTPTNIGSTAINLYTGIQSSNYTLPIAASGTMASGVAYRPDGQKTIEGTTSAYGATYANNDVIGVALNMDAGTLTFYKNNVSQGVASSGLVGSYLPALGLNTAGASRTTEGFVNFGQRPFTYTPPTGFVRLNTYNLPDSTIVKGNSYMDALTYTGTGVAGNLTGLNFQPDFTWTKQRSAAGQSHILLDVNRPNESLSSDSTSAGGGWGYTFLSNGIYLSSGVAQINASGSTYVMWSLKAGNGTSSNTSGTITSTVSVNTTAGFSIVTYTGTGANATVGHGLGVAPKMIITKNRSIVTSWNVYHVSVGNQRVLLLNSAAAQSANSGTYWNNTSPTSTVFSLGTDNNGNGSGNSQVAYCWAEIAGFSKFDIYTGNGSTNGPFIYTGFRPKFVIYKRTNSAASANWWMQDASRNTFNPTGFNLQANATTAESNNSPSLDFLANGYKIRTSLEGTNNNTSTYIYMAFAENPFKNSLAR